MAEYHALNQRLWQQYNSGEIDATHLQQTRFSLFAEQVNVAPMAMNETFLQQIIALSVPLEGVEETLQALEEQGQNGDHHQRLQPAPARAPRQTGLEQLV